MTTYPVILQQAGRVDRYIHAELRRKHDLTPALSIEDIATAVSRHDDLEDAPGVVMVDLDDVMSTYYAALIGSLLEVPDHAEYKRRVLQNLLETGEPVHLVSTTRVDETR